MWSIKKKSRQCHISKFGEQDRGGGFAEKKYSKDANQFENFIGENWK